MSANAYSYSRLKAFTTCALKYRFKYVDRLKPTRGENVETFLGKRVHEALEFLHRQVLSCRVPPRGEVLARYAEGWAKEWTDDVRLVKPGLGPENYRQVGERCVGMFYDRYRPFDAGLILGVELAVRFPLDERRWIAGFVDLLRRSPDGAFEIHDYKTGGRLMTQEETDGDRQLALYDLAVRHMFPDAREVRLVWHYLRFDQEVRSSRTPEGLADVRRRALAVIGRIEAATEFPLKESGLCDYCEYFDICPAKRHLAKVGALPAAEFAQEDGVQLVDRLAALEARRRAMTQELEAELKSVREALAAYAAREGFDVVVGSECEAIVRRTAKLAYPRAGEQGRAELEALVRRAGHWDDVSSLSVARLEKFMVRGRWPRELAEEVRKLARETEEVSVRLRTKTGRR